MAGRKQTQRSTSDSLWATLIAESYIIAEVIQYQSWLRDKTRDAWDASNLQRVRHWMINISFTASSYTAARGKQIATTLQQWIHNAWGYQWLTTEPEPDIIVIDLRETLVLGPILKLVGLIVPQESRVVQTISSYSQGMTVLERVQTTPIRMISTVLLAVTLVGLFISVATGSLTTANGVGLLAVGTAGLYGLRDTRSWDELRESRTINAIEALLEPPAPPERASQGEEATLVADKKRCSSKTKEE